MKAGSCQMSFLAALKRQARTAANLSSNVEGSMFGKSLRATRSRNSIKGTTMKTANGITRSKSRVVRRS